MGEQVKKKTSKLAITSFVCLVVSVGIFVFGLFFHPLGHFNKLFGHVVNFLGMQIPILMLLASVMGVTAFYKIVKSKNEIDGMVFCVPAIFCGLLVLIVYAHLFIKDSRLITENCTRRLVSIGNFMQHYANENKGSLPQSDMWYDVLIQYCDTNNIDRFKEPFICYGGESVEGEGDYVLNKHAVNAKMSDDMVLVFEGRPGWNQVGGIELLTTENHKGKGCNILFGDGRVEFVKTEELSKLKWEVE